MGYVKTILNYIINVAAEEQTLCFSNTDDMQSLHIHKRGKILLNSSKIQILLIPFVCYPQTTDVVQLFLIYMKSSGGIGVELRMDHVDVSIPISNDGWTVHTNIKVKGKKCTSHGTQRVKSFPTSALPPKYFFETGLFFDWLSSL